MSGGHDPGPLVRFLRSQYSWNGEPEVERQAQSSPVIAGWAAARPFPNLTPFAHGPQVQYFLPDGPTGPRDLLQRAAPPSNFPGGWTAYDERRPLSPEGFPAPPGYATPVPRSDYGVGYGLLPPGFGSGPGCPCLTVEDHAEAIAIGLRKALPNLGQGLADYGSRAQGKMSYPPPANLAPPVRSFPVEAVTPASAPVAIAAGVFADVVTFLVPRGLKVAITGFGQVSAFPADFADEIWRIVVDQTPVPNFNNLQDQIGTIAVPAKVNVLATELQTVRVQAAGVALGHNVRAALYGHVFVPQIFEDYDTLTGWKGL